MLTTYRTDCSDCRIDLKVDTVRWEVSARIPSNGKRGSLHVPAHTVTAEVQDHFGDGMLLVWECPACGYSDSLDTTLVES